MTSRYWNTGRWLATAAMTGLLFTGSLVTAEEAAPVAAKPATWELKPDIMGILLQVPALKQPLPKGWQPTLFWWQVPLSFDNPAKLKEELQALSARGLLPCIELEAEFNTAPATLDKRIAEAKAVAAAGFPVHLAMKGVLDLYRFPDGKLVSHADAPNVGKKDAVGGAFPCLILKDGWKARAEYTNLIFKKFADAKIPVAGVWYDYEGHPHPWNGIFEHSQSCPGCRKEYPAGVLDDRNQFMAWCMDAHAEGIAAAFAKPIRATYPQATIGFYGYAESIREHPYTDWCGVVHPPSGIKPLEIDVIQPVCYAQSSAARRYFNADWPISREEMDKVYFATLLRAASQLHHNIRANQFIMPFVSSWVMSPGDERVPRMSKPLYREFLRHAILRGARGFYCFNVAPPYGTMADFYNELVDLNVVYNGMFAHREFLENGVPLNDTWADPKDATAVIWSGLRLGDKAIVRVVAFGPGPRMVEIIPFPGRTVRLNASPEGMGYIVDQAGGIQAVE